jgi:hypothetical protein
MLQKIALSVLLICSIAFIQSCKKDKAGPGSPTPPVAGENYTSEYKYNLNVIYFVAADRQPNHEYHKRISKILLDGQEFFKKWMLYWGYGDKTFGLLKDNAKNLIKITYIKGKQPQSSYPYNGGSQLMSSEINAYFATNPSEKKSDHYLVISAVNVTDPDAVQNSNVPYYGIGRWCYALDFPGLNAANLGAAGTVGSEATKWIGGMLHELGHGINLPHAGERVSERNNPVFGTSLMGGGNYTYGKTPTFLTQSSCAILNNGQLFTKTDKTFYSATNASVKKIYGSYIGGNIIVSGKFASDVQVDDITFYHRPVNNAGGYTAMTWVSKPIGADSFYISMPVSEFWEKGNTEYEFSVVLHHTNGNNTSTFYGYEFQSDVPAIDFGLKNEYDKTNWTVVAFSSEETAGENGKAINILDGNQNSYWHSRWSSNAASYPHFLTVDMQQILPAKGFTLAQRGGMRKVKDIELLISNDNNTWESLGNFVLKNFGGQQVINLPAIRTFRYFKIVMNTAHDGQQFAALAEAGVIKD